MTAFTLLTEQTPLATWLSHLESLHGQAIELGLDRVQQVKQRLQLTPTCPVFVVAGTNGKGSICALLSTMLRAAGFRVGTYTSPHLLRYNERVRIDMEEASDTAICAGLAAVEQARGDISLTYFEFGTLAAVACFMQAEVDVMVLEVGLGGRLDAVNVFDADCAIISSIDLDHQDWLGDTRELIGREKAGVFRQAKPVVCADPEPPQSLLDHAYALACPLKVLGRDFGGQRGEGQQWLFWSNENRRGGLPVPALRGNYQIHNASAVIAALELMRDKLPVSMGAIRRGLVEVEWPGRFQVLPGRPVVVWDVGHNPHAARGLAANLTQLSFAQHRYAVFSVLADKDIDGVIAPLKDQFDTWLIAPIDHPRALPVAAIAEALQNHGISAIETLPSVAEAWQLALSRADENDRIVVFGSFFTVAAAVQVGRP